MQQLMFMFTLKPIILGFIGIILIGMSLPLAGVIIIRNSLIPLRYMLMHGVILGGAIGLALEVPLFIPMVIVNFVLVIIMLKMKTSMQTSSTAMMVCSMGLASLITHLADVPAKDTLEILWGSPFALTEANILQIGVLALVLTLYCLLNFKNMTAMFYDVEIAKTMGLNTELHKFLMVTLVAVIVAVSMKIVGALLMDALLILPVLCVQSRTLKGMLIKSSIYGLVFAVLGYLVSIIFNLPVSGALAVIAVIAYLLTMRKRNSL